MSTSNRTDKASAQKRNIDTMNEINTSLHIKQLEGEEYLAMKDKMAAGASCKSCIDFIQKRYHTECKMMAKTIRHYNICTAHRVGGSK